MSTVRRIYFYTVSLVTLGIFAAGVQALLRLLFELIRRVSAPSVATSGFIFQQLSLGLAMLLIGGGLWFPFWRSVERQVAGSVVETGSAIRKLFLNFILTVSALVTLTSTVEVLNWLLAGPSGERFPASSLATGVVVFFVWFYHWRVNEKEGHPSPAARTLRRWYVYILSAWGLIALSVALVQFISNAALHLPFWGRTVAEGAFWNGSLQSNISWILLGAGSWVFHWLKMSAGDYESTLRQVYLYLLTILGSAIAGLTALTNTIYGLIRFPLGGLDVTAGTHFRFLGWTLPTMLVAAAIWTYHQQVVAEEAARAPERDLSARRVLHYLMSFIGLGTGIAGLIMLVGLILELLTNAVSGQGVLAVTPGWWRQQLSLSLALLIVGVPLWIYYWGRVMRIVTTGGVAEYKSRSRRIFIYVVVAAAIITLAADLVNIIYQLLNGLLQSSLGISAFRQMEWSLQSLVAAVPVLWYHWRVLRADQRLVGDTAPVTKRVTLVVGEGASELAARIEHRLGYGVHVTTLLGPAAATLPAPTDVELDRLAREIESAPGEKVMLIMGEGRISLVPYRD